MPRRPRTRRTALVTLVLATLALPATASAQAAPPPPPLMPAFGELLRLDGGESATTYWPDAVSRDGSTVAAWREDGRVLATRLDPAAGAAGVRTVFARPGRVSAGLEPVVAVTGTTAHVAWMETGDGRVGVVLATSHDGGLTWGQPRDVTPRTRDHVGQPRIAAEGDRVYVVWEQTPAGQPTQLRTAGSRDGGVTFPCQARVSRVGDEVGSRYDVAVDGTSVHFAWQNGPGEIVTRRSADDGRTLEEPLAFASSHGTPRIVADGDNVVIVHGRETIVTASADGGSSFSSTVLSTGSTRCLHVYCGDPMGLDLDGDRVVVAWIGSGGVHAATSTNGGQGFGAVVDVSPVLYTSRAFWQPSVDVEGRVVSISWHASPRPGTLEQPDYDLDPYVASSLDGGASYTVSDLDDETPGQAIFPAAIAHAEPSPASGAVWWRTQGGLYTPRQVRYRGVALSAPDAEVLDATITQGAADATRLIAGRPTAVKLRVKATYPRTVTVPVRVTARYTGADGPVTKVTERDVVLPGGQAVTRHLHVVGVPEAGTFEVDAEIDPERTLGEADRDNNVRQASRPVVAGAPLRILVVGVHASDEDPVSCGRVQRVAEGTRRYLDGAWPVDPRLLRVDAPCAADVAHAPALDSSGFARMFTGLDRLIASGDYDRVVGVVPDGWFGRQAVPALADAGGLAPFDATTRSALVDARAQAGWVVSHELAHELGWVTSSAGALGHLDRVPAPGYWVREERAIADRVDAMHPTATLAELRDETARWTSQASWDFLSQKLAGVTAAPAAARASAAAAGPVLDVAGTVSDDGAALTSVQAADGAGDATDPEGALTLEQLDAGGAVVATHGFDAGALYGALGTGTTEPPHDAIGAAPFAVRVALQADAASVRLRRGADVLATRARSAAAPQVAITAPAAGATIAAGTPALVTWTATDADADALRHTVEVSKDGTDWLPVATGLATTELEVTMPDAFVGDAARVRVITTDGWRTTTATSGAFSVGGGLTDGRLVTFDAVGGGERRGVWTANADGSDLRRVVDTGLYPRWSPDGTRIAYSVNDPAIAKTRIHTASAEGGAPRIISPGADLWPRWMGSRTVATRHSTDAGIESWYDAKDQDTQDFAPRAAAVEPCDLSGDGTRGLFLSGGYAVGDPDGTNLVNVPLASASVCGALSPDGTKIIGFSANELAIYTVATGAKTPIAVNTSAYDLAPQWSPTGEWIYWASSRSRQGFNFDLWRIRPDGTGAEIVLDGDTNANGTEESTDRSWYTVDLQPLRSGVADPEPRDPSADAGGPYTVTEGSEVMLDASGTTAGDAAVESLRWDTDGDGAHDDATGATTPMTPDDDGALAVGLLAADAAGRSATDAATVTVTNADPVLHDLVAAPDTGGSIGLSARVADPGTADTHTATVDWGDGSGPLPASIHRDGTTIRVLAAHGPLAVGATVQLVVRDDDGGSDSASVAIAAPPANGAPSAGDAQRDVPFATGVDVELPATDPEGDRLTVEVVQQPAHGRLVPGDAMGPAALRMGYVPHDDHVGEDAFTYRVLDASGGSQVATVRLDVQASAPDQGTGPQPGAPERPQVDPSTLPADPPPVPGRPLAQSPASGGGAGGSASAPRPGTGARTCVSRRSLTINVPGPRRGEGRHRRVKVSVDGQVVTVRRGRRIAAPIDLRGLPKGRVKVTIAITRADGRTTRSTRTYRTCVKRRSAAKNGVAR